MIETLEALGNVGDFVGGIAVIVTLAYLAVQIRRSTRATRAATLQQWVAMAATVNSTLSASSDFARLYRVGCENYDDLEPHERSQFMAFMFQTFNLFESLFLQAQNGEVDDAFFEAKMGTLFGGFNHPGVRQWWEKYAVPNYDPRFRQFVERRLSE